MTYSNIGDKIIALAKMGYATQNTDKTLMSNIANWARTNTTGWTLSATDPKTGTVDSSWSPNQEDWTDVYNLAASKGFTPLTDYLKSSGYYFANKPVANVTADNPQGASSYNSPTQTSQATATQQAQQAGTWNYGTEAAPVTNPADPGTQPSTSDSTTTSGSTYDPVADANQRFANYQKAATGAANNDIDAQMAYANSIINSGGIWKTLQPIAQQQMQDSIAALEKTSAIAKANVESARTALNAQEAADYQEVIKTIDDNLTASRQRTTEEMNQRGLFFSTVLDSVMGRVEAASATQRGNAAGQDKARLAKIASDMAVMSGNIDIETIKGNAAAVAEYTAQMLQVVAQDEKTKQEMEAVVAKLKVQKAGVFDAVAAQVFPMSEQMRSAAIQEGYNAQDRATAATNNDFNTWLQGIGQYSNDYQDAINKLNPNDPLYSRKYAALESARNDKIATTSTDDLKMYLGSIYQFSNNYQAEIDRLNKSNDPNKGVKIAALMEARDGKLDTQMKDWVNTMSQFSGNYQAEIDRLSRLSPTADPNRDRKINYLQAALEDQRTKAATATSGGSGGGLGGSAGGATVSSLTVAQALSIRTAYLAAEDKILGFELNPQTGLYEKTTTDSYGAPKTETLSADQYKILSDRVSSMKPNYDMALKRLSQKLGTALSDSDQSTVSSFEDRVDASLYGVPRDQYASKAKVTIENILYNSEINGKYVIDVIMSQDDGEGILRALEQKYGITIRRP
jgi:hypothetical protein